MTTDFSYGGKQNVISGPIKPSGKDMPGDARTRVDCYADIASIPNPYVGLKITVKVDETNNNKMTDYIVKSLKANSIVLANSLIDEVVRYADYLEVSSSGGGTSAGTGEGLTAEQTQQLQTAYAHSQSDHVSMDEVNQAIANAQLGREEVDLSSYATKTYVDNAIDTALDGHTFKFLTQAEYDALETKDPLVEYHITDSSSDSGSIDTSNLASDLSLSGSVLQLKNSNGTLIGNSVTLPSTSGSSSFGLSFNYFNGKVLDVVGDSQTADNSYKTKSYHEWIKELLGFSKVNNYGVSGSTIAENSAATVSSFVSRITSIDQNADMVIVMGGVNDVWFNTPMGSSATTDDKTTFYGAMTYICKWLILKFPTKPIIFITPTKQNNSACNNSNTTGLTVNDFRNAMIEICNQYSIPVLDAYALMGVNPEIIAYTYTTDGLHLNDSAHEKLAKLIVNYIMFNLYYPLTISTSETEPTETYGQIVLSTSSLSINEGNSSSFTVKLDQTPTNNQIVNLSVDNDYIEISPRSLTFTPSNYDTVQTITVNAKPYTSSYENKLSVITLTSSNVTSKTINVTNVNTDSAPILNSISAIYTQGSTKVYQNTPLDDLKSNLVVKANYSDGSSQTVTGYTLSGNLVVGTSIVTVSYSGKTTTFNVVVSEDVYATAILSTTSLSINEGESKQFTVRLDQQPSTNMVINLNVDNSYCTLSKSSLTFTPSNYNVDQAVSVTTVSDVDGDKTTIISLTNENMTTKTVTVTVVDVVIPEMITDGLVCWLESKDVNYGDTTWNDKSGNNNNCVVSSASSFSTEDKKIKLGDNEKIKISSANIPSGTKTYEINYELINEKYYNSLFYCGESTAVKLQSVTSFGIWNTSKQYCQDNIASAKSGVITVVVTSEGIKLYQNGVLKSTKTSDTSSFIDFTGDLYINKEPSSVTTRDMYSKYIVSFKIYNRELSADEIATNYQYEQWLLTQLSSNIPEITDNYDVFVIAGQSNAVGYGTPKSDNDTFDSSIVYQYKQDNTIEPVSTYPLDHYEIEDNAIAFQHTFISKYIENYLEEGRKILLVPCASSGTSFVSGRWQETGDLQQTTLKRIAEVKSMNLGNYDTTFKAVLWHQGESDIIERNTTTNYKRQLTTLITNVRNTIGDDVPFIMGDFQENWKATQPTAESFVTVIREIANEQPNCYLVSSEGLTGDSKNGTIHFSATAQRTFGERYYSAYETIINDYTNNFELCDLSIGNVSGTTWTDSSSSGNNATISITGTGGLNNNSIVLDGNDYISLNPNVFNFGTSDFTVQVVGKFDSTLAGNDTEVLISQADGSASINSQVLSIYATSAGIVFAVLNNNHTRIMDLTASMNTNESSFAIVRNGEKLFAYINDVCVGREYIASSPLNVNATNKVVIGKFGESSKLPLHGYIKGVHIEKRALNSNELMKNKTRFTTI